MLTGPLTASEQFRHAQYDPQILAGVVNSQIVVEPDGYLERKTVVRVPFDLTEGGQLGRRDPGIAMAPGDRLRGRGRDAWRHHR
jgi:hypothetical protein